MKTRDPEMHKGMLEVVEMFRNRDKEGLINVYAKILTPHGERCTEIQEFIIQVMLLICRAKQKFGLDTCARSTD